MDLHPFTRGDFARLIAWADSAELLMQWAGHIFTHPLDEAQLENYLQGAQGDPPKRCIFKAVEMDEVVGHIELNNIDRRNRAAVISRVLVGPKWRGRGLGVELVRKAADVAFRELGLHRIELFVFDFNLPAIACYRRAGFTVEGRLRDARRVGDEFWSLHVMGLLAQEWKLREG